MNDYIINPAWFYWVEVFESFRVLLLVIGIAGALLDTIAIMVFFIEDILDNDNQTKKVFSCCKKLLPIFAIMVIIAMFIPSKDTMYTMMIARHITEENLIISVDAIKNAVDYIIESINSL